MKAILTLIMLAVLAGCATQPPSIPPEPKTIVKIERIVAPIPHLLLDIPDEIPNLLPEVILKDDKAVAKWLLDSEARMLALEEQIRAIRALYIKQLKDAKAVK